MLENKSIICEICGKHAEVEPPGCSHYPNEPDLMTQVQLFLDGIAPAETSPPVLLFRALELHAIAMSNELKAIKRERQHADEAWARFGESRRKTGQ